MRDAVRVGILALILVGVTALLFEGSARRGQASDPWSTYQAGRDGARALFLLLAELGHDVRRRHQDFALLETPPALVVSVAPKEGAPATEDDAPGSLGEMLGGLRNRGDAFSDRERDVLIDYIEAGGRLLLLASRQTKVASALAVTWETPETADAGDAGDAGPAKDAEAGSAGASRQADATRTRSPRSIAVLDPDRLPTRARRLSARVPAWLVVDTEAEVLAHADDRPVMVRVRRGQGEAILASIPGIATNVGLRRADNALLLADLAAALVAAEGGIEFDEAHHGLAAGRGIAAYLRERGLLPAVAQVVIAAVFLIWWLRRRTDPSAAEEDVDEEPPPDLVMALAETYRKGFHRDHAVHRLLVDLLDTLCVRHRIPPSRDTAAVAQQLEAVGQGDLARSVRSLELRGRALYAGRTGRLGDAALLSFARAVARASEDNHGRS